MDVRELKNYIYENRYVEQILESIGCHHIKYHASNAYWTCANATGDNVGAIVLYNKTDLVPVVDIEVLKEKTGHCVIPVSALEETGIRDLEETIWKQVII